MVLSKEDSVKGLPEFRKRTDGVLSNLNVMESVVQEYLEQVDPFKSQ